MGTNDDALDPEPALAVHRDPICDLSSRALTHADTSPAHGRNFAHGFEGRLTELMEGAITSHSIARQYLRVAKRFVAAARRARREMDRLRFEAHLREARKAHDQARKCLSFARLCRRRAECLAVIADYPINRTE